MTTKRIFIDRFDSADHIKGKARTYEAVKAAVLAAGRFSCFEASQDDKSAAIFTRLCKDPELELTDLGYPWTGVKLKAKEQADEKTAKS
jgi:hypothetical protein